MQAKPKTIKHPNIAYDQLALSLNMHPRFIGDDYITSVNVTTHPYRTLPDGTIDVNESLSESFHVADVAKEAGDDPALAMAMGKVGAARMGAG